MSTVDLNWIGDLSAETRTQWVDVPEGTRSISVINGWTGTGAPIGSVRVEFAKTTEASAAGETYPVDIDTQPAGVAGCAVLFGIVPASPRVRLAYTPASGGAGDVFTDGSCVAGTKPSISFWS